MNKSILFFVIFTSLYTSFVSSGTNKEDKKQFKKSWFKGDENGDILRHILSFLEPKDLAKMRLVSCVGLNAVDAIYKNIPLEKMHEIFQDKEACEALHLCHKVQSLSEDDVYTYNDIIEKLTKKDFSRRAIRSIIGKAYILLLQMDHGLAQKKLRNIFKKSIKEVGDQVRIFHFPFVFSSISTKEEKAEKKDKEYPLEALFDWIQKYDFLNGAEKEDSATNQKEKALVQLTCDFSSCQKLFKRCAFRKAIRSCKHELLKKMIASKKFMQDINADDRGDVFFSIAKLGCCGNLKNKLFFKFKDWDQYIMKLMDDNQFMQDMSAYTRGDVLIFAVQDGKEELVSKMLNDSDYMKDIPEITKEDVLLAGCQKGSQQAGTGKELLKNDDFLRSIDAQWKVISLRNVAFCGYKDFFTMMVDNPVYMAGISAENRVEVLKKAIEGGHEVIINIWLEHPKFIEMIKDNSELAKMIESVYAEKIKKSWLFEKLKWINRRGDFRALLDDAPYGLWN